MSLRDVIAAAEATPTHLRVCAPAELPGIADRFGARNVTVEYTRLPAVDDEAFVVVSRDGAFVGSVGLAPVRSRSDDGSGGLDGPVEWRLDSVAMERLLELLDDVAYTSLDRRQMLATSREIEDRAWRVGRGRLYTGFQSFSAMRDQVGVYRRLATKPGLDVHVFGEPDWEPPPMETVAVHPSDDPDIARTWFVVFEGTDRLDSCALLAEERSPGEFYGFWTYDPDRVAAIVREIRGAMTRSGT
ncbi:DICT sensory domain-containing protein [Halorarius halobius]|uniref:DICT sensory domain-containing protein n=1 Tax=Halorarius halobius TaxID=2962671 RepID=UPI0020CD767A|nr:DICT sensory domain-containing protein [Halorarius halobius]